MVYQNLTPGLLPSEASGWARSPSAPSWAGAAPSASRVYVTAGMVSWRRPFIMASFAARSNRSPMIQGRHAGRKLEMVDRECFTVAPFDGHYEPLLECGTRVRRGDVVGLLHDFDHIDIDPWPAVAGVDGVVLAQAWVAPVPRGQHIVVVGREIPWS